MGILTFWEWLPKDWQYYRFNPDYAGMGILTGLILVLGYVAAVSFNPDYAGDGIITQQACHLEWTDERFQSRLCGYEDSYLGILLCRTTRQPVSIPTMRVWGFLQSESETPTDTGGVRFNPDYAGRRAVISD